MPASTWPAAKRALMDVFAAQADIAAGKVLISWGVPITEPPEDAAIFMLNVTDYEREWHTLGGDSFIETYRLPISVAVREYGDDQEAAENALADLISQMDEAAREDLDLGDAVIQVLPTAAITDQGTGPSQDGEGWIARATVHFDCEARV